MTNTNFREIEFELGEQTVNPVKCSTFRL